jgi:hypothetical protein
MQEDEIEVDSIEPIGFPDITPQLARASRFLGLVDLLNVAKHGKGEYLSGSVPLLASAHKRLRSAPAFLQDVLEPSSPVPRINSGYTEEKVAFR